MKQIEDYVEYKEGKLYWKKKANSTTNVGDEAGSLQSKGYLRFTLGGKAYYVHRVIYFLHHQIWVEEIDHIDRDKTNNFVENLRKSTRHENVHNSSKFMGGVRETKYGWQARISKDLKRKTLGTFKTKQQALEAYAEAYKEYTNAVQ